MDRADQPVAGAGLTDTHQSPADLDNSRRVLIVGRILDLMKQSHRLRNHREQCARRIIGWVPQLNFAP
jgi:hypothetical protein